MKKIIAITSVILSLCCVFCSCSKVTTSSGALKNAEATCETADETAAKTSFGNSNCKYKFFWEFTDEEGKLTSYAVYTDEETVDAALSNYALMTFTTDEEGNVTIVNNQCELGDGAQWAFYVDGQLNSDGPAGVQIEYNHVYSFVAVK